MVIKLHRSAGHLHRLLPRLYVASAQTFKLSFNLTLCNWTFSILYHLLYPPIQSEMGSLKHVHVNPAPHLYSRRQNKLAASSFNVLWLRDGFRVLFKESWWLIISTILTLIFSQSERFWSESSSLSSQIAQHAHRTEAHSLVLLAVRLSGHVMETDVISKTLHDKWLTAPLFWWHSNAPLIELSLVCFPFLTGNHVAIVLRTGSVIQYWLKRVSKESYCIV